MKTLPSYAKTLLLYGANITGNFTEGYNYIEESLKINHASELLQFCKWIDENIGGASIHNIDMLFKAFKYPDNAEAVKFATVLAEKIKSIKLLVSQR
jgi:hypothetical protein